MKTHHHFLFSLALSFLLVANACCGGSTSKKRCINEQWYNGLDVCGLKNLADATGLTSGIDMMRIRSYIDQANVIVEIGSGYGRASSFALKMMHSKARLYLIEPMPCFASFLRNRFNSLASVIERDINRVESKDLKFDQPDLVLWMWSGIADVSFDDQQVVMQKLSELMNVNGLLVIDLPKLRAKNNCTSIAETSEKGTVEHLNMEGVATFTGFLPSFEYLEFISNRAGFMLEKQEDYITPVANRERTQYFFRRS